MSRSFHFMGKTPAIKTATLPAAKKMETLSDRLYRAMVEKKITKAELGRRTEVDSSALCRFVSGKKVPTPRVVARLATVLGCSEEWLLYGVGPGISGIKPFIEETNNPALEQLFQDIKETYLTLDNKAEAYELLAKIYQNLNPPKKT